MPNTSNGTAYTTYTATPSGAGQILWAKPNTATTDIPIVLYLHGANGGYNQFTTLSAWSGLRDWLIDNGWGWIEGAGGGAQPWGNAASRAAYRAAFDHVDARLDIGPVVILARSMGGLVGHWLFT